MAEKILDVITRTSIDRMIKLSKGEKIKGELYFFDPHVCFPLFPPYEVKMPLSLVDEECLVRISKLVKGQQGMTREVVYELNVTNFSLESFMAQEDGEYLIEIKLEKQIKGALRVSMERIEAWDESTL